MYLFYFTQLGPIIRVFVTSNRTPDLTTLQSSTHWKNNEKCDYSRKNEIS